MKKEITTSVYTFRDLIENDLLYVDKTEYLYRLVSTTKGQFFCARPRRFGKSLVVSTLREIFAGNKKLFEGLYIGDTDYEWHRYPVIDIDFSRANVSSVMILSEWLTNLLQGYAAEFRVELENADPALMFSELIEKVFRRKKRGVVLLIDEYDKPVLDHLEDEEDAEKFRAFCDSFYQMIKGCEPYFRFVFITGVTKFTKVSIFNQLNSLNDITINEEYAGLFGYTKEEILAYFGDYIDEETERRTVEKHKEFEEEADRLEKEAKEKAEARRRRQERKARAHRQRNRQANRNRDRENRKPMPVALPDDLDDRAEFPENREGQRPDEAFEEGLKPVIENEYEEGPKPDVEYKDGQAPVTGDEIESTPEGTVPENGNEELSEAILPKNAEGMDEEPENKEAVLEETAENCGEGSDADSEKAENDGAGSDVEDPGKTEDEPDANSENPEQTGDGPDSVSADTGSDEDSSVTVSAGAENDSDTADPASVVDEEIEPWEKGIKPRFQVMAAFFRGLTGRKKKEDDPFAPKEIKPSEDETEDKVETEETEKTEKTEESLVEQGASVIAATAPEEAEGEGLEKSQEADNKEAEEAGGEGSEEAGLQEGEDTAIEEPQEDGSEDGSDDEPKDGAEDDPTGGSEDGSGDEPKDGAEDDPTGGSEDGSEDEPKVESEDDPEDDQDDDLEDDLDDDPDDDTEEGQEEKPDEASAEESGEGPDGKPGDESEEETDDESDGESDDESDEELDDEADEELGDDPDEETEDSAGEGSEEGADAVEDEEQPEKLHADEEEKTGDEQEDYDYSGLDAYIEAMEKEEARRNRKRRRPEEQVWVRPVFDHDEVFEEERKALLTEIRRWYGGYRFYPDTKQLYNPVSLGLYFNNGCVAKNYWFSTGMPAFMMDLFKNNRIRVDDVTGKEVAETSIDTFNVTELSGGKVSQDRILQMLFQTGFLTIRKLIVQNGFRYYSLKFPNREVKKTFQQCYVDSVAGKKTQTKTAVVATEEKKSSGKLIPVLCVLLGLVTALSIFLIVRMREDWVDAHEQLAYEETYINELLEESESQAKDLKTQLEEAGDENSGNQSEIDEMNAERESVEADIRNYQSENASLEQTVTDLYGPEALERLRSQYQNLGNGGSSDSAAPPATDNPPSTDTPTDSSGPQVEMLDGVIPPIEDILNPDDAILQ